MSRNRGPNVSASLIHEARMILQQFLGNRQSNFYSAPLAELRAKTAKAPVCKHPVLKCCFCVDGSEANAVINGYSVCERHEPRARSIIAVTPIQS